MVVLLGCRRHAGDLSSRPPPLHPDRPEAWTPYYESIAALGDGFVVWESFRAGHWRIWMRGLDGSPEQQLSPEEPSRDHVAAHIAPDGRHLVYLSLPAPHRDFGPLPPGERAPLHLVRLENRKVVEDRVLVSDARAYDGSRVALWTSPRALTYIAGDNTTRQIDILTGEEETLIPHPKRIGMLVNATRTHATNGRPTFSVYHPDTRTVSARPKLPGCEPYFTLDGALGYWVADVGGPFRTYDLGDYTTTLVLERDSKWLPKGRGYIYYPMASANRRLLAFGASQDAHGHFDADFDIFVAPLDPELLEVDGTAVRYSFSPGTDRFPDVWISGNELGIHRGEAPFEVTLAPDPGDGTTGAWSFDFGDGTPETSEPTHVYRQPGTFNVVARREGRALGAEVHVAPAAPPEILRAELLPGGREIDVLFDEPVDVSGGAVRLSSGARISGLRAGDRGRELVVTLAEPLAASDELAVEGISDRAGTRNVIKPARVPVAVANWPGSDDGLVFAFETDGRAVPVSDVDDGRSRTFSVAAHGRSRFDAYGALRVTRGWFEVEEVPGKLAAAFRQSNAFTLEATVWPELRRTEDPARIVSLAVDAKSQNLSLSQDGTEAVLRVRLTRDGEKDHETAEFGKLEPGVPNHILVTYRSGRLAAYQNGQQVLDTDAVQGDLSDWRNGMRIAIGADPGGGGRDFAGRVEGVALYTRWFEPSDASAHAYAYLHEIGERKPVPRVVLNARLLASSVLPTPERIVPYREALVVNEYEVPERKREAIGSDRLRVAHWAVLDRAAQPVPAAPQPGPVRLEIEPWESHPRLEAIFLSDTLDPDPEIPLYLDVGD